MGELITAYCMSTPRSCLPRSACACICSSPEPVQIAAEVSLPACRLGLACRQCPAARAVITPPSSVAIVIAYGFHRETVRVYHQSKPLAQYLGDMTMILRLVLSLRRVNTRIPINVYLSGERRAAYEEVLRGAGVDIASATSISPPPWALPFHANSFAKLLALALVQFTAVLSLDIDCVVLRNIDHMLRFPTPSFAYQTDERHGKCVWEMQSGVMLLRPDAGEFRRAMNMTASGSKPPGDGGDQSVWRAVYPSVHELPAAYNAFKYQLRGEEEWSSVFVLHDGWTMRWTEWWPREYPAVASVLQNLTVEASMLMSRVMPPNGAEAAAARRAGGRGVVCYKDMWRRFKAGRGEGETRRRGFRVCSSDDGLAAAPAALTPPKPWERAASPGAPSAAQPAPQNAEPWVRQAVSFINSPSLKHSSTERKRAFLRRKGLSEAQTDEAFRLAAAVKCTWLGNGIAPRFRTLALRDCRRRLRNRTTS